MTPSPDFDLRGPVATHEHEPPAVPAASAELLAAVARDQSGGALSYPFRHFLRLPALQPEVRQVVATLMRPRYQPATELTAGEVIDVLLEELCGPDPLTHRQMVAFLDAAVEALTDIWRKDLALQMRTAQDRPEGDRPTAHVGGASPTTSLPTQRPPLADRDFLAARHAGPRLQQLLAALEQVERESPDAARWFRLCEFTGATVQELAAYFEQPPSVIQKALDIASLSLPEV